MPSRVIRGDILHSRSLGRVSRDAANLFIRLTLAADEFGRMDGRWRMIHMATYGDREDASVEDVVGWLKELESEGCIDHYQAGRDPVLRMPNWERHRHKRNRASQSEFPCRCGTYEACGCPGEISVSRNGEKRSDAERSVSGSGFGFGFGSGFGLGTAPPDGSAQALSPESVPDSEPEGAADDPAEASLAKRRDEDLGPGPTRAPRPPKKSSGTGKQSGGTEPPEALTDDQREKLLEWVRRTEPWAEEGLDQLVEECLDWHRKQTAPSKRRAHDWVAACRNWIRRDRKFAQQNARKHPSDDWHERQRKAEEQARSRASADAVRAKIAQLGLEGADL